jgi:hypothetical protein
MLKAKSHTPKKLDNTTPIVDYGYQRVASWTAKALAELQQTSRYPVAVELANGDYTVGTKKVTKVSQVCWKVGDLEFVDKRSAIVYCALVHVLRISEAKELHELDSFVGKLDVEKATFRVKLDNAHFCHDSFKIDLFSSRYADAKDRLTKAKQELEKILVKAKYII